MPGSEKCFSTGVQHNVVKRVEITKQLPVKIEIIKTVVNILVQEAGHPGHSLVRLQVFCGHCSRVHPPTIFSNHPGNISFVNQVVPEDIQAGGAW